MTGQPQGGRFLNGQSVRESRLFGQYSRRGRSVRLVI